MHITREKVADMFSAHHQRAPDSKDVENLVASARKELRKKFLTADVGISGANFLLADSGAVCTVTN
jgi:L-lactate dehydrogenase complex protein LldF